MTFKHNETSFSIKRLTYSGNISSYSEVGTGKGHFKPTGLNESTFNLSGITEDTYKLTFEGNMEIKNSDKIVIDSVEYNVKDTKSFKGINLSTQKILLTK